MIELEQIAVRQGAFRLEDVSLSVPTGAHAMLTGRTGSGKTTLLETIAGLRTPIAGRILLPADVTHLSPGEARFSGPGIRQPPPPAPGPLKRTSPADRQQGPASDAEPRDVTHLSPAERHVGYVPQDGALFDYLSVRENVAFALRLRRWPRSNRERRVAELADWLGIAPLLDRRPGKLSGGERQRVAVARALAASPPVLLLDEPTSALDDATREAMLALLIDVRRRARCTILHVTHHRADADRLADVVWTITDTGGVVRA